MTDSQILSFLKSYAHWLGRPWNTIAKRFEELLNEKNTASSNASRVLDARVE